MKIINFFKNIFVSIKTHIDDDWKGVQEIQNRGLVPKS